MSKHRPSFTGSAAHPRTTLNLRRKVEGATENQRIYVDAIKRSDVTLCEGVAGTGKTFLPVGLAVHMLLDNDPKKKIKKLVICRPVVPAGGEDIGFLPGDLNEKTDPYMAPIYESIRKFCRDETEYKYLTNHNSDNPTIEVCPLGLMRGRTFDDAFVILDEAQNASKELMLMFLTRMGQNCKMVITGDLSQSDLDEQSDADNGLLTAITRLEDRRFTKGTVSICYMTTDDIMRHGLIGEILTAWNKSSDEGSDDDEGDSDGGCDDGGGCDNWPDEYDSPSGPSMSSKEKLKRHRARKITNVNRISKWTDTKKIVDANDIKNDSFGAGLDDDGLEQD